MVLTNPRPFEPTRIDQAKMDRVRQIYENELKNPTVAKTRKDIPQDFDHISNEWLTDCLAHDKPEAKVVSYKLGATGTGTANRQQIYLEWNEAGKKAGLPSTVFCKATFHILNRLNLCFGALEGEIEWFNHFRHKVPIDTPESYHALMDYDSYNSILMLKELDNVDWTNYKTNVTRDMLIDMAQNMAKLHGTYWESSDPTYAKLMTYALGFQGYAEFNHVKEAHERGWIAGEKVIPKKLFENVKNSWDLIHLATDRNAVRPQTLCHNDGHIGNWYQRLDNGKMCLTDFQTMGRGDHARDMAYMISCAVTSENRRAWEKDVIKIYLAELKKNGGPDISFDDFFFEYRVQMWTSLVSWTLTLGTSPEMISREDWQPDDICLALIGRMAQAIDDLDSAGATESIRAETPRSKWNV